MKRQDYFKRYELKNKEKRSAYRSNYYFSRNKLLRDMVLDKLGKVCCRCGFSDIRALQIDHIHSDGCSERKRYGNSSWTNYKNILASIKNGEKRHQILCANCNWIKRYEKHEFRRSKFDLRGIDINN